VSPQQSVRSRSLQAGRGVSLPRRGGVSVPSSGQGDRGSADVRRPAAQVRTAAVGPPPRAGQERREPAAGSGTASHAHLGGHLEPALPASWVQKGVCGL